VSLWVRSLRKPGTLLLRRNRRQEPLVRTPRVSIAADALGATMKQQPATSIETTVIVIATGRGTPSFAAARDHRSMIMSNVTTCMRGNGRELADRSHVTLLLICDTPLCRPVVDAESVAGSRGYPGKRTRHRDHSVNSDVTSPDFLQRVDNSGLEGNSTKATNDDSVYPCEVSQRGFSSDYHAKATASAFWSSSAVTGILRFPSPEGREGGRAIGE
jgi:hypothetical protein